MNRIGILYHSMHDASHFIINSRVKEIKVCLMGPLSRSNYHNWAISIKFVSHNNNAEVTIHFASLSFGILVEARVILLT